MKHEATQPAAGQSLFLIEFYVKGPNGESGWEINFAWVFAADMDAAEAKLASNQAGRFDEVIGTSRQAEIKPLAGDFRVNTPDANLFIIR